MDKKPEYRYTNEQIKNAFFVMRLVQQPVLPQDVYSPSEVMRLLGISKQKFYNLADQNNKNPLPVRNWGNGKRGSFILREDLIEWLRSFPYGVGGSTKTAD